MDQSTLLRLTIETETQKEIIRILREQNLEIKAYADGLESRLKESIDMFHEMADIAQKLVQPNTDINKTT